MHSLAHPYRCAYACTAVRARGTRYTFKTRTCYHAVSHTHRTVCPRSSSAVSVRRRAQRATPPKIPTSPFINHRHQHNSSSHTCLPHPVSVCPSSSHFSQKDSILKKQQLRWCMDRCHSITVSPGENKRRQKEKDWNFLMTAKATVWSHWKLRTTPLQHVGLSEWAENNHSLVSTRGGLSVLLPHQQHRINKSTPKGLFFSFWR